MMLTGILFTAVLPSYAYDPLSDACAGQSQSATCNSHGTGTTNPLTGTDGIILKVANAIAILAGAAAIIMLIISGIRYVTSNGDSQAISNAKRGIISALVGLLVIGIARVLVALVVKGLSP